MDLKYQRLMGWFFLVDHNEKRKRVNLFSIFHNNNKAKKKKRKMRARDDLIKYLSAKLVDIFL